MVHRVGLAGELGRSACDQSYAMPSRCFASASPEAADRGPPRGRCRSGSSNGGPIPTTAPTATAGPQGTRASTETQPIHSLVHASNRARLLLRPVETSDWANTSWHTRRWSGSWLGFTPGSLPGFRISPVPAAVGPGARSASFRMPAIGDPAGPFAASLAPGRRFTFRGIQVDEGRSPMRERSHAVRSSNTSSRPRSFRGSCLIAG